MSEEQLKKHIEATRSDKVQVRGFVRCRQYDEKGKLLVDTGYSENGVTATGVAAMAGLTGNVGSVTAFTFAATGSGTTAFAKSQTALVTEIVANGLERAAATVTRSTTTDTNDTLQFDKTFSVTGTQSVEEVGIFNAASAGIMLARKLTGTLSFLNGHSFALTYKIVIVASSS